MTFIFRRPYWREVFLFLGCVAFSLCFFYKVAFTRERTFFAYSDNSIQSYAWLAKTGTAWRNLEPPLWDFAVLSGTSFVGEMQTAPFYLPTIFLAWLSPLNNQRLLDIYLILHYALACYFMLAFLRIGGVSLGAAAIGAIIFAFVGTVAQKASAQSNIFMGMVYLPIVLGLFLKGLRSERGVLTNTWLYLCGIALGFSLLAGHLQPYVHSTLALALLVPFLCCKARNCSWRNALTSLIFVGVVSVALTAIQLIPTVEYLSNSYRWIGTPNPINGLAKPPYDVYARHEILQVPQLLSMFRPADDIRDHATMFITLTGLALAGVGCFYGSRLSLFALVLAVFSVLLALGHHTIIGQYSWYVPILNNVREPVRAIFLYHLAVSMLAALGAQRLAGLIKRRWWPPIVFALGMALLLIEVFTLQGRLFQADGSALTPRKYYARTPVVNFLEQRLVSEGNTYRIASDNKAAFPPNIGNIYRIHSTMGHRATMYAPYFGYLNRNRNFYSANFDRLGAKYIVSVEKSEEFPEVMSAGGLHVYERPNALPVFQLLTDTGERKPVKVSSISWSQNAVRFELENAEAGQLLFAQPHYPGWRVSVDGRRRRLNKSDIFMSVQLSGGERTVAFTYAPLYLWVGLLTSLLVLTGLAFSLFVGWRSGTRGTPKAETAGKG